jgi:alkylation response protein AidB-like acyl-CoA dehydrogenase
VQPWQDHELERVREHYREWAQSELAGDRAARDAAGRYDQVLWKKAAAGGLLGLCMPEQYGGSGRSVSHTVAAYEGVAEGCADGGFVYGLLSQLFGIQAALVFMATDEAKQAILPPAIAGDQALAYGFTEQQGGSDAFLITTRAHREGDDWVISGRKVLVTNAPEADVALVFARTSEGRSPFALSAFVADLHAPGASKGQEFGKVGLRTVRMGELVFDQVRVPASHVVGRIGSGLRVITESTNWERAFLLVTALGQMRRVLAEVVGRSKHPQLDRPIGGFDQISGPVADLVWRYRLCRMVTYDLAGRFEVHSSTNPHMQDAAIAKLFVSENYQRFMSDAMRLLGVGSLTVQEEVQQHLRDGIASTIYSGTSETLRKTIAKLEGLAGD